MKEIDINERVERAAAFFRQGYNCSQSVVLAYADLYDLEPQMAAAISSSLGAGMGRLREVCGAVSGMFVLAGLQYPAIEPTNRAAKTANYAVVQSLAQQFRQEHGSIVCRELLGLNRAQSEAQSAEPEARTEKYYATRPCVECVQSAARIFGQQIVDSLSLS
ncbi:MAG: C-GCAxxG-C-C family protein [Mucinivorans sp.]